ncbi:carboxylesterase family domain-containing protein [Phthorimaea operculella]|nr:carboxylesterase family domain-containing protein [Phthorimaea operculella]
MAVKMKLSIIVLVVIFILTVVNCAQVKLDPLVRIDQGLVRGQIADGGKYAYFLGVPYAQVNPNNPFGQSEPHPGFGNDIFNAYDGSIACPQNRNSPQSLDCLRLNIYVPYEASSKNPLPVLFWIHGGDFTFNQASQYDPKYFMDQGIVVVTINYRLGPYGFMCLDSPLVPGNQGLKDQHEALRWVRKNIAAFGGNPYEVTIGGQSAGSCSVLLQLFSPKEKLFKRAIAQSGTPFTDGLFVESDIQAANKLAEHLGYNATNTEEALEFLARTPSDLVIGAYEELSLDLKPCKERSFSGIENFIETYPSFMSNEKKIKDTPILIGHTTQEAAKFEAGGYYGNDYYDNDPFLPRLNNVFDLNEEQLIEAASIVRHFYIGDEAVSKEVAHEIADFESDFLFNHPIDRMITKVLKENANPVYEYVFAYLGDSDAIETSHSDELNYIFDMGTSSDNGDNRQMIKRITTLWANFVKFGNPTPSTSELLPVEWKPVTENTRPYMVLDEQLQMKSRVFNDRMAFWDLFFERYASNQRLARKCTIKQRFD